jgi:F-type H+-transporting ATPase subunit delta
LKKPPEKTERPAPAADLEPIFADLELVDSSFRSSLKLRGYFENPRISFEEKTKTFKTVFQNFISPAAYDFVVLLVRGNALASLTDILRNYKRTRAETGILELEVATAVPLSLDERNALVERFSAKLGRPLQIRNVIDPTVIAGLVVRAGDIMVDASIRAKLSRLAQQLRQGG